LFPQKLTKQKRENWNLPKETSKLESEMQKRENWNRQQKLEKLKPEKRKREN
jgi:hypothetical protein